MRLYLPITSILSLPLLLLPLPWHIRARNIATLTIFTGLFTIQLTHAVNSIVWARTVAVKIPVWCDITTKLMIGCQVALPAASMCITKHLAHVSSVRQTIQTDSDKRRRRIFELFFCGVLPCIIMALHYVVQGHRFDIIEDFGCIPTACWSIPTLIIVYLPGLVLALASLVYAVIALVAFIQRHTQISEFLAKGSGGLSRAQYNRLMLLAVTEMFLASGVQSYILVVQFQTEGLRTWDSWADVHSNFSRIAQVPHGGRMPEIYFDQVTMEWLVAFVGSVAFSAFFGFGQDALAEYKNGWNRVKAKVFRCRPEHPPPYESVLPKYSIAQAPRIPRLKFEELDLDEPSFEEEMWAWYLSRLRTVTDDDTSMWSTSLPRHEPEPHENASAA